MGQLTVTQHEGYVEYRFTGAFDDESLDQTIRDLWTAPDYEPTHNELYNLCYANFSQITGNTVRKIMDMNRQLHADAPQLFHALVANDDLHYGLSRMSTALADSRNPNVRVFRDYDEAVRWISANVP